MGNSPCWQDEGTKKNRSGGVKMRQSDTSEKRGEPTGLVVGCRLKIVF